MVQQKKKVNCQTRRLKLKKIAAQHDNAITAAEWESVKSDCIPHAHVDLGFAVIAGGGLAVDAVTGLRGSRGRRLQLTLQLS